MLGSSDNPVFSFGKEQLMPQEEKLEIETKKKKLKISIAKESAVDENRVALAPHAVELLINNGHEVMVEHGAGIRSNFTDMLYSEAGAIMTQNKSEIYQADIVIKVSPLNTEEIKLLKGKQVLINSFQIGTQTKAYINQLQKKKITAIAYEYLMDRKEEVLPIVRSMSEISGTTSILIAAEFLSSASNGKGEMLGGISGIAPTDIVILGAGTAGEFAARTALGLGATVKVFDCSIPKLRDLQERLGTRIFTSVLQPRVLTKALKYADVVIGAIPLARDRQAFVVSEDSVKQMKPHSVIIDLNIDHGGCFETSDVTCFQTPTYYKHGILHYCVPNIPSRVARTATYALSNIMGQLLIELGEVGGINHLIRQHRGVRSGTYLFNGILTKESIGHKFSMPYQDISLLMAAF